MAENIEHKPKAVQIGADLLSDQARPAVANDILDDRALAQLLGVTTRTIRLWRDRRKLPFLRLTPRVVRFRWSDVQRWMDAARTVIS